MGIHLRQLDLSDLDRALELRYEGIRNSPTAFMSTIDEAMISSPKKFPATLDPAIPDSCAIGLFDGESLIGIAFLMREEKLKRRHVAWIQGVYIKPEYRGRGLGRSLVESVIDHARTLEGVSSPALRRIRQHRCSRDV